MQVSQQKVQTMRRERGWSQEKLAAMSGLSERTIQRVEADGNCSLDTHMALASTFEVSPGELAPSSHGQSDEYTTSWSGALGLLILGLTTPCLILLSAQDGRWEVFSFAMVMSYTLVLSFTQFGLKNSYRLFDNSSWLVRYPLHAPGLNRDIAHVRSILAFAYTSGLLGSVLSAIVFLTHMRSEFESGLELGLYASRPLFYALVFGELWFRPYKRRMEGMLLAQSSKDKKA
jgi:DNA-binding XRE family transcriptional regulator